MAVDHYENFPVASILLPRRLRTAVQDIYRFARSADDIADEGIALPEERLAELARYRTALDRIQARFSSPDHSDKLAPIFTPLAHTIDQHALPLQPFFDLLSAFEQDVGTGRYRNDYELFDYCARSANPVGLLMLHLYNAATPANIALSNHICTGLQLTNFWQDIAIDWRKSRLYLPLANMARHGVTEQHIALQRNDEAWRSLMSAQTQQARELLIAGLPLARRLGGRIGFELNLVILGGLRILECLNQLNYDVFRQRPVLRKKDWALLLWRALRQTTPLASRLTD